MYVKRRNTSAHGHQGLATKVRRFREKNFFASKRNGVKRDPFRMRFARSRKKISSFCFEFFASDQSEINRAYFRFVSLPKIFRFASFSFCFRFISFSFRFRCENKRKNTFFALKRKKFHVRFASFHFEAKMMAVFCFRFASFRFKAKKMVVFASFSFCFLFVLFSFRFRFLRFASMRNKRKKHSPQRRLYNILVHSTLRLLWISEDIRILKIRDATTTAGIFHVNWVAHARSFFYLENMERLLVCIFI